MRIYNTMSRKLEKLEPIDGNKIRFFVCGPTIYDDIHIGNARTFVIFDSIAKYLRYSGYMVFYLQNITDVDDRIIEKSNSEGIAVNEVSRRYLRSFMKNMEKLRVDSISLWAKASDFIDEIIEQISKLMEKDYAYRANDGIYFRVDRFKDYGKLSGQKIDQLKKGGRVETDPSKERFQDFVLWKFRKPGEPFWNSPWGEGRPGWHIEDTAITEYFFGSTYDLHGAGSDLIFPHHEAEIAQMRSISGEKILSKYWLHSGMLNIVKEKMAKSLGNMVSLEEALKKFEPEDIRFFFLNSGYRNLLEYSEERIIESSTARSRIQNLYDKLHEITGGKAVNPEVPEEVINKLMSPLENDFDTRSLFRDLMEYVSEIFRKIEDLNALEASSALKVLNEIDSIFGIISHRTKDTASEKLVVSLKKYRDTLRSERKFSESDEIRNILRDSGIQVEDS